jgi:hypothetical protein
MENFGRQVAALLMQVMQAQPQNVLFTWTPICGSPPRLYPVWRVRLCLRSLKAPCTPLACFKGVTAASLQRHFVSQVPLAENSIPSKDNVRPGRAQNDKVRLSALLFPTRLAGAWHVECGVESGPRMSGVLESSISRPVSAIIQRIHVSMRLWATEPVLISYRLGQESLGIHAKPSSPCRHRDRSRSTCRLCAASRLECSCRQRRS